MKRADDGRALAAIAEALYLVNLLLAPGLAFLVLLFLYRRHARTAPDLASAHLRQTLSASLFAGALLVAVNLLIVAIGGYQEPATWVVAIVYFVTCHAALVLLGALGLARAMAGQPFRFPLVGGLFDGKQ